MGFEFNDKDGWYTENIITEQDMGTLLEFVEKEKKWFNYIKGKDLNISSNQQAEDFDAKNFSHQGLGTVASAPISLVVQGCTCNGLQENGNGEIIDCSDFGATGYNFLNGTVAAFNYYDAAVVDDGSCVEVSIGCTDQNAYNYDPLANTGPTWANCFYPGCTDHLYASNYDVNATVQCASSGYTASGLPLVIAEINDCCEYCNYGCTDASMFNYSAIYTCDGAGDGSYGGTIAGQGGQSCEELNSLDPNVPLVNCDCEPIVHGCMDGGGPYIGNQWSVAPINTGPWVNVTVANHDPTANTDVGSLNTGPGGACVYNGCYDVNAEYSLKPLPVPTIDPSTFISDTSNPYWFNQDVLDLNNNPTPIWCWDYNIYPLNVTANFNARNYYSSWGLQTSSGDIEPCPTAPGDTTNCTYSVAGCMDPLGCTYNATNTVDDGSCLYCGDANAFNFDNGITLSSTPCGVGGNTDGNCVDCPKPTPQLAGPTFDVAAGASTWGTEVPIEITVINQFYLDYIASSTSFVGGVAGLGVSPQPFSARLYKSPTLVPTWPGGYEATYDYEEIDVTSSILAFVTTTSGTNPISQTSEWELDIYHGLTPVTGSRVSGTLNTTQGYNGSTLTLEPGPAASQGNPYKLHVKFHCAYDYGSGPTTHTSSSDWQMEGYNLKFRYTSVDGCMDALACNYDSLATNEPAGACTYANANADCAGNCLTGFVNVNGSCVATVNGCTDSTMCNYSSAATFDDGSCCPCMIITSSQITSGGWIALSVSPAVNNIGHTYVWTDPAGTAINVPTNYSLLNLNTHYVTDGDYTVVVTNSCSETATITQNVVAGCTDSTATNYNSFANYDDSSCTYSTIYGCTDSLASNYNPAATVDDGSCCIYGCPDPLANNYSTAATCYNGTCTYTSSGGINVGCIDPTAINYNPTISNSCANCCTYPPSPLAVGDTHEGGTIFYILQPADTGYVAGETHGLIAATEDIGAWQTASGATSTTTYYLNSWAASCNSTLIGGTSTDIGTGLANSLAIDAGCTGTGFTVTAAEICLNYTDGTYTDWYLPSMSELMQIMFGLGDATGASPTPPGFAPSHYWSSSEASATHARYANMAGGAAMANINFSPGGNQKAMYLRVRPIRSF